MKFSPVKMATTGSSIKVPGFLSSSYFSREAKSTTTTTATLPMAVNKLAISNHRNVLTFAAQESSAPTVAATEAKEVVAPPAKAAVPLKKPAAAKAKAPAKALPETIIEDVIPTLRTILEAQDDVSQLELAFADNRLEGSFLKKGIPYSFWAFFPDGTLTGPKGFSLSSYGQAASSVEPFLVDEKKVNGKLLVFWVKKRLAAQGILPVWID